MGDPLFLTGKSCISAQKILEKVVMVEEQDNDILEQQVGNLTILGSVSEDATTYIGGTSAKSNSSVEKDPSAASAQPSLQSSLDEKGKIVNCLKFQKLFFSCSQIKYSKTCVKQPLKKRQNKDLYDKW